MKKLTTVLAILSAAAMTLSACGGTAATQAVSPAESVASGAESTAESIASTVAEASYPEDVQAIIDSGVLRVGVKNAVIGFGYEDPATGEYTGMEIDIANKIAEALGVEVEFTPVTAATRTELLDAGDIDCVLATFTITDERKQSWDFTTPYYTDHVTVLVQKDSGITDFSGLVNTTVGVSSGSTSARALVAAMIESGDLTGDGFDAETFDAATWTDGIAFRQYDDYPSISTALSAGEVNAFCVDKSILAVYHTEDRDYISEEFAPQDYGIATKKGSGFSAYCEDSIKAWLADGTIDAMIADYNLG